MRAYDLVWMLSREGRPTTLGQVFTEYGRIAKALHLLAYVEDDDGHRRKIEAQLNIQESPHQLARRIFQGLPGELRSATRRPGGPPQGTPGCKLS